MGDLRTNGRYAVLLRPDGTGFSAWDGIALTTWSADRVEGGGGLAVFVRDVDRGDVAALRAGSATIDGLQTTLAMRVVPDADAEVRRVTLKNQSGRPRRLEITTYAEIVLHDPGVHAGHPGFAKLFVQTEHLPRSDLLLARRRPRGPGDRAPLLMHGLAGPGRFSWCTDRARVLRRGGTPARPRAIVTGAVLEPVAGSVLDPVCCARRTLTLPVGGCAEFLALLAAADDRETLLATMDRVAALDPRILFADDPPAAAIVLPAELQAACDAVWIAPRPTARARAHPLPDASLPDAAPPAGLRFANGIGGFTPAGDEYVMTVDPRRHHGPRLPPMPWTNVVANPTFGFLVSETGAGCTWSRNSREHRLTPWTNDPIADPHGEALWIRDEEVGTFWSPLPGPTPAPGPYEVRHGFGQTQWRHTGQGLAQETTMFVGRDEPVKVLRLRIGNAGNQLRRLAVVFYARLVLGTFPSASVTTERDPAGEVLFARNPGAGEFSDGVAFAAAVPPANATVSSTTSRAAFFGPAGTIGAPDALARSATLPAIDGQGLDACFAVQIDCSVDAGAIIECAFLLGETTDAATIHPLVTRWRDAGAITTGLAEVRDGWRDRLTAVQVSTPSPGLDLMMNGWLLYQAIACRLWGRTAFYQSGGAFGFRDQLQDSMALLHAHPSWIRDQVLLHAGHQFPEGDVLHWWHPPADRGTRTRVVDDLLWLPYVTAFYVGATGDGSILDAVAPFVTARPLAECEDEAYVRAEPSDRTASIYEHCCLAIERSLSVGAHGLPLMGTGDWNDGMNRVGRDGLGESVWMAFFLYDLLGRFAPLCARRGDRDRADRYRRHRRALVRAIERTAWDGQWYRRAYYDDGTPLGTASGDECRIDALAQSWAVISGAASHDRGALAMESVARLLVDEQDGLVRLLVPPFDRTSHEPGYIKGYVPGIRENGGQYTHAACWVIRAAAELGWRERALRWLERILPVHHAADPAAVATYQIEPYVVAADVYGVAPHEGRGGWSWYTGSAAWLYRVALESVLGVTLQGGTRLRIAPRVPDAWSDFRVRVRVDAATVYDVEVRNPSGRADRVTALTVDGRARRPAAGAAVVRLRRDGRTHAVAVTLGV